MLCERRAGTQSAPNSTFASAMNFSWPTRGPDIPSAWMTAWPPVWPPAWPPAGLLLGRRRNCSGA